MHPREREREREGGRRQMDSPTEGKSQTSGRLVMHEVENIGRCTMRLEGVLQEILQGDPVSAAIVKEIGDSAARASRLLVAGGWDTKTQPRKARESGHEATVGSPSSVDQMISDVSTGKRKLPQSGYGRRRGCLRGRSQKSAGIRVEESKTLDDGHQWRKYGQKEILNSPYPRSYFRCTHKRDQKCEALRQVQKSESDPPTFIITYIGEHTCRDPALTPHSISPSISKGSRIINFGENTCEQDGIQIDVPSLKVEHDDELSNLTTGSSSSCYYVVHEVAATPALALPVTMPSQHAASSLLQSPATSSVPMDLFMTESNFEDVDMAYLDYEDFFLAS